MFVGGLGLLGDEVCIGCYQDDDVEDDLVLCKVVEIMCGNEFQQLVYVEEC